MNYIIPAEVRDALVRYLGERPYREVHRAVADLLALEPVKPADPPASPMTDEAATGQ